MTNKDYAVRSLETVIFQMTTHTMEYIENEKKKYYKKIKELMKNYSQLIIESRLVIEDMEDECKQKIDEDMEYALTYLEIFDQSLDVVKMRREVNNLILILGLTNIVYRAIALVEYYAPEGTLYSEILYSCYCGQMHKKDIDIQQELGIGRTCFYKKKKEALEYLRFYLYCIVIPQSQERFRPLL